jgi:hypothetical protein
MAKRAKFVVRGRTVVISRGEMRILNDASYPLRAVRVIPPKQKGHVSELQVSIFAPPMHEGSLYPVISKDKAPLPPVWQDLTFPIEKTPAEFKDESMRAYVNNGMLAHTHGIVTAEQALAKAKADLTNYTNATEHVDAGTARAEEIAGTIKRLSAAVDRATTRLYDLRQARQALHDAYTKPKETPICPRHRSQTAPRR